MISKEKHKKHGDLVRPNLGKFGRNEVAVLGTTCQEIQMFHQRIEELFPEFDIAFADADHDAQSELAGTRWQDKITAVQMTYPNSQNEFQRRQSLSQADAIVVNGNHFEAATQIIICNPEKESSLRKRASQLTSVKAIVLLEGMDTIPEFVREILPDATVAEVIHWKDDSGLKAFFEMQYLSAAPLKALILAGGRSIRMGKDKSRIVHHGEQQFLHLKKILTGMGIPSYVSCREDQADFFRDHQCEVIIDKMINIGPLGGIVSAWMTDADAAWLVLACDVPLLDESVIQELMNARMHLKCATAFQSPFDKFPEPLIAIWEPKAYALSMQFIAQGYSCPRKVLINSDSQIVKSAMSDKLENINTMEELEDLHEKLAGK